MSFRRRGIPRSSVREVLTANRAALEAMAIMADKPLRFDSVIKPKRERAERDPTQPLEREVLKAVVQALRAHPSVAFAWRMQSGMFQNEDRTVKVGVIGMPDVIGMLKDGRFFGCEVKRPGGRVSEAQQYRLKQINEGGGLGFVAYSVDDVIKHLRGL